MSRSSPPLALIHSPLVGPFTWSLVADVLRQQGVLVLAPTLDDAGAATAPFWRRHADAVARDLATIADGRAPVLIGHSGAGPLLPAIQRAIGRPVSGYLFVDAGLPHDGKTRFDLMAAEDAAFADGLRRHLAAGGRFPDWSDDDLRSVVPDPARRRSLIAELRPRPLAFFEEPLPVFAGWPDVPCAYLQLSSAYDVPAGTARAAGWPVADLDAGHFHMLVDPAAVADALLALVARLS